MNTSEIKQPLVEGIHGTGGFIDSYDSRDLKLKDIAGATLPFSWDKGFDVEEKLGFKIKIKDQGASFSCGGQAWSYLAEVLEALSTNSYEPRSAKYIYAQTAVEGGGSYGRDNCEILQSQGSARESVLPSYPNTEVNLTAAIDITNPVRDDAKKSIFYPYAHAEGDIDSIAQAIRDHNGVVLGVDGENNGTWISAFPKPPKIIQWRHWVYAGKAKVIDGKKFIGIANSWGEDVGEKGWQWISEDYFTTGHVFDNWTHIYKAQTALALFLTDMRYGDEGPEIVRLQNVLENLGYFTGDKYPFYGNLTAKAVYAFQLDRGIIGWWNAWLYRGSRSICGPATRALLNKLIQ